MFMRSKLRAAKIFVNRFFQTALQVSFLDFVCNGALSVNFILCKRSPLPLKKILSLNLLYFLWFGIPNLCIILKVSYQSNVKHSSQNFGQHLSIKKTFTITSECLIFAFAVYPSENNVLSEYKMLIGDIFLRHCLGWISVPYICFVFVRIGSRQYLFHLENSIFFHEGNDSMRFL